MSDYKAVLEQERDNTDLMAALVGAVNGWDGSLDHLEVMLFDDYFFSTYFENDAEGAARAVFFGNVQNWADDFIRFNGYGNLESLSDWQYEKELQDCADEIIAKALELSDEIGLDELVAAHADTAEVPA